MVYCSTAILYVVLEMESKDKPIYKYLKPIMIGYIAIFTGVYLYLPDFFIFFLVGFIVGILTLVYRLSLIYRQSSTLSHQKFFIVLAVTSYIGGWLFFWIPEILFCDNLQSLNFHSWWHVTSTLGTFVMVLFTTFQREIQRGRNPQLNYNCFLGVPIIPYVHIPMEKKTSPKLSLKVDEIKKPNKRNETQG